MDIQTKFEVDQNVYYLYGNKVQMSKIYEIQTLIDNHTNKSIIIRYKVSFGGALLLESCLFQTKEELLNSL